MDAHVEYGALEPRAVALDGTQADTERGHNASAPGVTRKIVRSAVVVGVICTAGLAFVGFRRAKHTAATLIASDLDDDTGDTVHKCASCHTRHGHSWCSTLDDDTVYTRCHCTA